MRELVFDLSDDTYLPKSGFGGFEGEHNATGIALLLPERLLAPDAVYYMVFETEKNGEVIFSAPLLPDENRIYATLPRQVMLAPRVSIHAAAYRKNGEELVEIAKSARAVLEIKYPQGETERELSTDGGEIPGLVIESALLPESENPVSSRALHGELSALAGEQLEQAFVNEAGELILKKKNQKELCAGKVIDPQGERGEGAVYYKYDFNGDGEVNEDDVHRLSYYVNFSQAPEYRLSWWSDPDVNGDGAVGNEDVTALQNWLETGNEAAYATAPKNELVDDSFSATSEKPIQNKALTQKFAKTSQGKSAKYSFTTPGWKRILNIIRATNGAIDIGLASGNPYRMVQALAFDMTGFVKYPTDTSDSKPALIKRYENTFGQDNAVESHPFRITKIRVGYPKKGTTFPNTDGTTDYTVNPVNCYVDIYVDFDGKDHKSVAFNLNYAGFADSHNCTPIEEETAASDTGLYGEELTYYTAEVDSMPHFVQSPEIENVLTRKNVYSGHATGYGVKLHDSGYLSINSASETLIDKGSSAYVCITPKNVAYAVKKYAPTPKVFTFTFSDDPEGALAEEEIPIGSFYYRSGNDDRYDPSDINSVGVYVGDNENGEKIWTTLYQKM